MTAEELADHAQDAFENNLMDDPTPYEMGRAWKAVGERLFEILAERAEEERSPEIDGLCERLDSAYERQSNARDRETITLSKDTLERQAAEIKQLREEMVRMETRLQRWEPRVSLDLSQMLTGAAITGENT